MSKTATALLIKFGMTFVVAVVAFSLIDRNIWLWPFALAIVGTALNYFLGDLYVLPKFGNTVAAVSDGVLAALTAYVFDLIIPAFRTTATTLVTFAVLVAVGEYIFHRYLRRSEKVEP